MSDNRDTTAFDADGFRIWSCVTCRRRKVRCDRRDPCNHCMRQGIPCHFPVTGRLPRRREGPGAVPVSGVSKASAHRQSELLNRLRRLEAVVTEMSAQVEDIPGEGRGSQPYTAPWVSSGDGGPSNNVSQQRVSSMTSNTKDQNTPSEIDEDFGRLIIGQGSNKQVGHQFWTIFCDEVNGYPFIGLMSHH